ncbi:FKBP-type peptidyl-prolyl cis-trans isomerase [Candidatus Micrarchaeota archaeon]|nr:FKBP-type peptidyl-prolyl cis-trans isomerase [Candidatus Micrarchaeota archaeon]
MMKSNIILFGLVLLLFFGCVDNGQQTFNNSSNPSFLSNTTVPVQSSGLPPGYTVDIGDTIWINYIVWVDGTIIDTTNETLAKEFGIYNPYRKYEPLKFKVFFGSGVIDGLVSSVVGMSINETIGFAVEPKSGYGPYDTAKLIVIPRYYNLSLYETVPRAYLEDSGITNISNGTSFQTDIGLVSIQDFNDENVTLFYFLQPNQEFTNNGVPQRVVGIDVNYTVAEIEFMLDENQTYILPHHDTGVQIPTSISAKSDTNITIDYNHPFANKTLVFEVTLLDAEPYVQ